MKNKKYLILLPSLILSSCNFKNTILYLGENILINEERITTLLKKEYKDLNDEFASSNFIMKDFYAILEKDGLNLKTSHKISDVLKKTNKIIFNIGNYELLRLINTSNYSFSYDEEVLKNNKELFDYYFHQSLDILTTYTSNIVVVPLYNSLINRNYEERLNNLVNQYNSLIKEICDEYNVKYINVNKLSSFVYEDNHVNMNGYNYLLKNIK